MKSLVIPLSRDVSFFYIVYFGDLAGAAAQQFENLA